MALFVKQKKVNSRAHILFSLLASLIAHHSCQSLYIALEGCNRKNFHRLIFCERKCLIFGWQRTPIFELAYLWPTKRSEMRPREFTFLVWQPRSVVVSLRLEPEIRDTLHVLAEVFIFHSHCKGLQKWSFRSSKQNDLWVKSVHFVSPNPDTYFGRSLT